MGYWDDVVKSLDANTLKSFKMSYKGTATSPDFSDNVNVLCRDVARKQEFFNKKPITYPTKGKTGIFKKLLKMMRVFT